MLGDTLEASVPPMSYETILVVEKSLRGRERSLRVVNTTKA